MKIIASAVLAVVLAAPSGGYAGENWDLASAWPAGNFHVQNAMKFAQAVEKQHGDTWVLCARAPSMEAAARHAGACGGTHRAVSRGKATEL